MKKDNKEFADKIKSKLEDFDTANPLPAELSKENITETLKQQTGTRKKSAKIIRMKQLTSVAAALVIVFGAVTAFHVFDGSARLQKALDGLKGDTAGQTAVIETAQSEKQIVDLFNKMSKQAAKDKNRFSWHVLYRSKDDDIALDGSAAEGQNEVGKENSGQGVHGETNVQVKGIDEPDVMKNDGKYLYTVAADGMEVNIYSLLPADSMKQTATIKFGRSTDKSEYVNSLFVKDDLLVVFSQVEEYTAYKETTERPVETQSGETVSGGSVENPNDDAQESPGSEGLETLEPATAVDPDVQSDIAPAPDYPDYYRGYYNGRSTSVCTVYDISNRAAPKEIKRITQDGSFVSARLIGTELYVLSSYYINVYAQTKMEDVCIPAVAVDGESQNIPVADISITKNPEPSYLVVCGINLDDLTAQPDKKAVLGGGSEAYCTADSLFASRTVYSDDRPVRNWGDDIAIVGSDNNSSTEIYRFAIGDGKVEYENSGKVAGEILNQFSMDQYKGYFRIATTQGQWEKSSSNVFVLNDKLEVVGKVENIAPKERIFAVRFMGDAGYVVTFEQTDPLFVLDLADPKAPKITGELKIPGFSTYLHPITDTLLLGLGQNGNENGAIPGIKLSLFDVSDPANPKEVDKLVIEGDCSSKAMNNHKAFMAYPGKEIFGIPVLRYNNIVTYDDSKPQDGSTGSGGGTVSSYAGSDYVVSSFETFTVRGGKIVPVMSYKENIQPSADSSYYYDGISRGTYVGDTIYTLSGGALTSFDMASGKILGALKITQPVYYGYDYGLTEPFEAN